MSWSYDSGVLKAKAKSPTQNITFWSMESKQHMGFLSLLRFCTEMFTFRSFSGKYLHCFAISIHLSMSAILDTLFSLCNVKRRLIGQFFQGRLLWTKSVSPMAQIGSGLTSFKNWTNELFYKGSGLNTGAFYIQPSLNRNELYWYCACNDAACIRYNINYLRTPAYQWPQTVCRP